jgi:serine/threonine protein kinase
MMHAAKTELEVLRNLPEHPNIIGFIDGVVSEQDGLVSILMEECSGGSVFSALSTNPSAFSERDILRIFRDTARGISHLHTQVISYHFQKPLTHSTFRAPRLLTGISRLKISSSPRLVFISFAILGAHRPELKRI